MNVCRGEEKERDERNGYKSLGMEKACWKRCNA